MEQGEKEYLDKERLKEIKALLKKLIEVNRRIPVIVEGLDDALCLRRLGLSGEIIKIHGGDSLYELCEKILDRYQEVVLLTDWDERGEQIHRQMGENLEGSYKRYSYIRQRLVELCTPEIKEVEELILFIEELKGRTSSEEP